MEHQVLIHVLTGEGKGKTTTALGMATRAYGHGLKVHIVQFLKGSSYSGELFSAARMYPGLKITQFGWGCPL
ncbi:MAG TPA: cob(I)yrinic acid a,c-diamide adenosyltransferase, partial [Bacillota bacterium]|nr:cob(I)yrinic acid a,c-diamide adenosyltransferase [Bacillota bacterium]